MKNRVKREKSVSNLAIAVALAAVLQVSVSCADPAQQHPLSTAEIEQTFSNVLDRAEVLDAANSTAENSWFADGRFISRWRNGDRSGTVTGNWSARDNERCIVILTGLPEGVANSSCGPIVKQGSRYLSFNSDGSVHGMHTLSPLQSD